MQHQTYDAETKLREGIRGLGCDAVYFLMFDGWKTEQVSNRWHYASRWSRHAPVMLVQPSQRRPSRAVYEEPERRIPRSQILHVKETRRGNPELLDGLVQAGQILRHMSLHSLERPLLWLYNPLLAGCFACVPAIARVYHASENYFHFPAIPPSFIEHLEASLRMADLVIAVSDGVAESIRERFPDLDVRVVTNGCDYAVYSQEGRDPQLEQARTGFGRVGVYVGNINARLDFPLIETCAAEQADTLWAYYGPVGGLGPEDAARWQRILRHRNVRYFGAVPVERIPHIYRSADFGIIPYRHERLLTENGFPLKALEMLATKLPVVSSYMRPIEGLSEFLIVAKSDEEFRRASRTLSRAHLAPFEREALDRLCRAHDYDRKFEQIVGMLGARVPAGAPPRTRLDPFIDERTGDSWSRLTMAIAARGHALSGGVDYRALLFRLLASLLPDRLKKKIPGDLKLAVRRLLLG